MNESDNDGRATLTFNTPSELDRNWAPAGFDRRHNLQMGFVYQMPWQSTSNGYANAVQAIVSDWQLNGVFGAFSGNPFTMTAAARSVNTPSNQQTADLDRQLTTSPTRSASPARGSTRRQFAQPTGVRFGNTGRNQFYGPGGWNLDLGVPRSFPVGGQKRLEARITAGNIFNKPVFANPQNNVTSGTFGQITGIAGGAALTNAAYTERSVVLGLQVHLLATADRGLRIADCGLTETSESAILDPQLRDDQRSPPSHLLDRSLLGCAAGCTSAITSSRV